MNRSTRTKHQPTQDRNKSSGPTRLVLISGMSGAGKSTTLKALEDLGYEAVDNLPLSLLGNLVGLQGGTAGPLAIGVDIRTRDFGVDALIQEIDGFIRRPDLDVQVVFLDCDDEILRQRYTETRRRHPMADERHSVAGEKLERRVTDGIQRERALMNELRDRADLVIDTSHLSLNDLRRVMTGHFALDATATFSVSILSFSYRHGVPREADLVFDARFLSNPHYEPDLRPLTGLDEDVGKFIAADPDFETFFGSLTQLLEPLFPRFQAEGKSYLTIAVGCTGGQHRSVYVAERLGAWLSSQHEQISITHRELQESRLLEGSRTQAS
ncbi:MAG: RNase adapter RapZ [Rhodospirillaceae bacterium]|nr:RNase adapter RapZ [Rhodospirillaceae bacterium]MBT5459063.1 RNase adapter RapZ [Rhodospirillaceae bacterium]